MQKKPHNYPKAQARVPLHKTYPVPILAAAPVPFLSEGKPVTIKNIENGMCRWPTGDGPDLVMCGHPVHGERIYCSFHTGRAYVEPREKSQPMKTESASDRQFKGWS